MAQGAFRSRPYVLLFFFVSGTTGLVLEVVWTRMLGTVFGNTVYAASTVLTAYMLGLALGSVLLGRLADRIRRPLVVYGLLEIGVGAYALLFPLLVAGSLGFYRWFYRTVDPGFGGLTAVRFVLSLLLLLPPTIFMGGTLPVLGRFLGIRHEEPGQEVGILYGVNTLGAVVGCFLGGFVLIAAFGIRGTLYTAAGAAIAVGLLAYVLGRRPGAIAAATPRKKPRKKQKKKSAAPGAPTTVVQTANAAESRARNVFPVVLIAFGVTGFCALACEILWTRILLFVMTTSVYSFATMLTTFLLGLGAGSFIAARFLVRRLDNPMLWFGIIEVLVGLSALTSIPILAHLASWDAFVARVLGSWISSYAGLLHLCDAFVILFLPAFLMGAAFPVVTTACLREKENVGRGVGQIYAANTIGSVLGAFAAGFLLIPALGTQLSLLTVVALNLTVGVVVVWFAVHQSLAARLALAGPLAAIAVLAFAFTPSDVFYKTINTYHHPSTIEFMEEHSTGTVTVHYLPNDERLIAVDGVNVAGLDFMLRTTQKLQGYIPLALHPNPRRVCQIGFGSGETARVGLDFGVEDYTVIEICPAVFKAGIHFDHINKGSYQDPRIRRVIMDGKNFALLSGESFDIVMNDSIYPGSSGSSSLYTVDHFRRCRERLAEGGLFSCWVPLDVRPREFRMMLKSFQSVFPHTSLWVASNCLNKHSLFLGTLTPLRIDYNHLERVFARDLVAQDLKAIAINDPLDIIDCLVCDEAAIRKMVATSPVNTDDRPRLAYSCAVREPWEKSLAGVLRMLRKSRVPAASVVDNLPDAAELKRRFIATNFIFESQFAQLAGLATARKQLLGMALKANPAEAHVASCEAELTREIRDLYDALSTWPNEYTLMVRLADKLWMAGRESEAVQLSSQLVAGSPPPPKGLFVRLARVRLGAGKVQEAETILRQCLTVWPDTAIAYDALSEMYWKSGRKADALRAMKKAASLQPHNELYATRLEKMTGAQKGTP